MESKRRTSVKTISWEMFHFIVLASILYLFTGKWEDSGLGALLYIGVESFGYFVHERLWAKFGTKVK